MFNALVIGTFIMHLNSKFPSLQLTVALFVLGMFASLILEGLELKDSIGSFGHSYDMWMDIDPHLLLFTLLPALLAGDAMTIDTSVARRVAYQCLYLAGPGVLVQAGIVASSLYAYKAGDWDFRLCLITGSILCATDPVAVVALLKELGASPMLTVQIQGESLLNDGTAIVLFLVSYNMMAGVEYDVAGVLMFLVKTAGMAWALGMFIGYFFFGWIRIASNRLSHSSGMIQITLTICCAYWSFVLAEGVLNMSGVLACVAASLVLAHHMWPHIVAPESLHHVWHTIESLGNIIIFFLAGALTGKVMVHVPARAYGDLILML
jgi:NhaP-type Na+/H+ or K+/H+ antiporter